MNPDSSESKASTNNRGREGSLEPLPNATRIIHKDLYNNRYHDWTLSIRLESVHSLNDFLDPIKLMSCIIFLAYYDATEWFSTMFTSHYLHMFGPDCLIGKVYDVPFSPERYLLPRKTSLKNLSFKRGHLTFLSPTKYLSTILSITRFGK